MKTGALNQSCKSRSNTNVLGELKLMIVLENRLSFFLKLLVELVVSQILVVTLRVFVQESLKLINFCLLEFQARLLFWKSNCELVYALLENWESLVKSIEQAKDINVLLIFLV